MFHFEMFVISDGVLSCHDLKGRTRGYKRFMYIFVKTKIAINQPCILGTLFIFRISAVQKIPSLKSKQKLERSLVSLKFARQNNQNKRSFSSMMVENPFLCATSAFLSIK